MKQLNMNERNMRVVKTLQALRRWCVVLVALIAVGTAVHAASAPDDLTHFRMTSRLLIRGFKHYGYKPASATFDHDWIQRRTTHLEGEPTIARVWNALVPKRSGTIIYAEDAPDFGPSKQFGPSLLGFALATDYMTGVNGSVDPVATVMALDPIGFREGYEVFEVVDPLTGERYEETLYVMEIAVVGCNRPELTFSDELVEWGHELTRRYIEDIRSDLKNGHAVSRCYKPPEDDKPLQCLEYLGDGNLSTWYTSMSEVDVHCAYILKRDDKPLRPYYHWAAVKEDRTHYSVVAFYASRKLVGDDCRDMNLDQLLREDPDQLDAVGIEVPEDQ